MHIYINNEKKETLMKVDIELLQDTLKGIVVDNKNNLAKKAVLFWENEKIAEAEIGKNTFTFDLKESGRYRIRLRNSDGIFIYSTKFYELCIQKDIKAFEDIKKTNKILNLNIDFYKQKKPFNDFSLAILRNKNHYFRKEGSLDLYCYPIKGRNFSIELLTTSQIKDINNFIYFSGYAFSDNLITDKNIEDNLKEIKKDGLGIYTFISSNGENITIAKDYLGIGLLFLYSNKDVTIVSNRYELLLIHAKLLGEKLELNNQLIKYQIAYHPWPTYTAQAFCNDLLIENCRLLNPTEYIEINNGEVIIKNTLLKSDLEEELSFNQNLYDEEIKLAAKDIINNLKVSLDYFKDYRFIFDVTGGLDSRIVISALTNITKGNYKCCANTIPIKSDPGDLAISKVITNTYKLPYFDNDKKIYNPTIDDYYRRLSLSLGIYNDVAFRSKEVFLSKEIKFVGYFGELSRVYITRKNYEKEFKSVNEYVGYIFDNLKIYRTFDNNNEFYNRFNEFFVSVVNNLPGLSCYEKLENFYLFFRNRIHGNPSLLHNNALPQIAILQSRHIVRARHMAMIAKLPVLQVQSDLIKTLNPILFKIPFSSKKDADDLSKIKKLLKSNMDNIEYLNLSWDRSDDNYENTLNKTQYETSKTDFWNLYHELEVKIFNDCKLIISTLLHRHIFTDSEAKSIFIRLVSSRSQYEKFNWAKWRIFNYLYDLYYQIVLTEKPFNEIKVIDNNR